MVFPMPYRHSRVAVETGYVFDAAYAPAYELFVMAGINGTLRLRDNEEPNKRILTLQGD